MPPMMTTRNAGRRTTASRGGRTGGQTGRGGGRTSDQGGRGNGTNEGIDEVLDFSTVIAQQLQDMLPTIVAQVGDHISNQGINGSQNDNTADDNIHKDIRNVNMSNGQNGCSKKEFVACKPKEFDGKGGTIAYTHWVEKTEAVQDISGYGDNQKVKYFTGSLIDKALTWWNTQKLEIEFWSHAMVRAGHAAYTDRFHELARLVPHLVTPDTKRIERGNGGEPSKEGNVKGDNKRARTRKVFAIVTDVLSCRTKNEEKDLTCKRIPLNALMVVI
ncbi:hypothetical protein Tco_1010683 [Tanacetum coccineum]